MMSQNVEMQSPKTAQVLLLVEDQALIRMDTAEELRSGGWTVYEAANADDALEQLHCHRDITALFTDIDMPGSMDGLQLSRLAKAECDQLKIVVTSGMQMPCGEELPLGAVFVAKPYHVARVKSALSGFAAP